MLKSEQVARNFDGAPNYVQISEVFMMRYVLHDIDPQRWNDETLDVMDYSTLCQAYYTRPNPKLGRVYDAP